MFNSHTCLTHQASLPLSGPLPAPCLLQDSQTMQGPSAQDQPTLNDTGVNEF